MVVSSLSSHISACFRDALAAKANVIERLLACERQRRGEYDPKLKALIAESGGQEIFMMLTDIKCRAADSWIKDVAQNYSESTYALSPTPEPTLPPELVAEAAQVVLQEAAEVAAQGIPVDAETILARRQEVEDETVAKINEIAQRKADKMQTRIADKLAEGGWKVSQSALIYDFTTYPACFLKGPVLRKKKVMKWTKGFRPKVTEEVVIEVDRVSPWDIFPSRGAVTMQDGYLIHRHRLSRKAIYRMKDQPGADNVAIDSVLDHYRLGLKTVENGDSEHEMLNGDVVSWSADGLIEAHEYWGPASGFMLLEWGLKKAKGQPIDEYDEYQIHAWKIGPYVIFAQINPDPMDQRPYSKASFEDIPGSFWGMSLPEMMSDVQTLCNAAARALANNMGIASGPQVEVTVDRLPKGAQPTSMYPWKQWHTTSDRSGNGQPAIRFFQPDMNAAELLQIYTYFSKIADEVTGVPNYIYGSTAVGGAGRTASGLSMLMENAAKGIKHAILGLDAAFSEMIKRVYLYLMQYDPDESIKGDMNIVPAGAIGAMIREQQVIARREFMAATLNPVDAPLIGPLGRAYMLRESAKGLFSDIDKVIPNPEKMKLLIEQQQKNQAMQQATQPQPGQPQESPAPAMNTQMN